MTEPRNYALRTASITSRLDLVRALWIVGFAAATAVAAQLEIPHQPVPYTLQTLMVLLAGAMLGKKDGALSQAAYLAAGVAGAPVFAHFTAGPLSLIGPTGGYLLSFPIAAFVIGYILENHRTLLRSLVAMSAGLFVIFSLGTLQLNFVFMHSMADAVKSGFLIFSWWDLSKLVIAAVIASRAKGR